MTFWEKIDKLSKEKKEQYAFIVALIVTGIIAVVWVTTLPAFLASLRVTDAVEDEDPFKQFLNVAEKQLSNVEQAFKEASTTEPSDQSDERMLKALGEGTQKEVDVTTSGSTTTIPHLEEKDTSLPEMPTSEGVKPNRPIVIEIMKESSISTSSPIRSSTPGE